jgi:DMSO/TMAO reductase YedYZ molybdopterin-dependent catalytic subunit
MNRRQLLRYLHGFSGGLVAATLLPACDKAPNPIFSASAFNSTEKLPDHLITPLDEFYVQSYALPPQLDANKWRLEITGAVNRPLKLSLADILAAPQETFYLTMECIGNPAGGKLIGNAQWTGTRLRPFLERAGLQPETAEIVLHGADYYETTLPVTELVRSDVWLVHQMNHAPLKSEHGYPLRIIVPGHFGQKQPKWLVKLEAIATHKQGFWERQGWSNIARIPTHALPQQIQDTRVWNRNHQVSLDRQGDRGWNRGVFVAGVALDHANPIQQVQISLDGGQTWQQVEQNSPASPHEWTLWRYLWRPQQPGDYVLLAKAISAGGIQPLENSDQRDGNSGVLKIQVNLQK